MVVPKRLHTYPVYFDYSEPGVVCANVTLSAGGRQWEGLGRPIVEWDRPTNGYEFDITLGLDFPLAGGNDRLGGPVMFETRVFGDSVRTELVSTKRGLLIPQISWLARLFRDFIMMVLSGLYMVQDKMGIEVVLIESFPVFVGDTISRVSVCMRSSSDQILQVYSGQLNFVSKLSGFKYLIAYHPIAVGMIVVLSLLAFAVSGVVIAAIVKYVRVSREEVDGDDDESLGSVSPVSPTGETAETEMVGQPEETVDASQIRRRISVN